MTKTRNRSDDALRRLGVEKLDVEAAPKVADLLKSAEGGLPAVLDAMRYSQDPDVVSFLAKYDEVAAEDRRHLSWTAIALAADVSPAHLLGGALLAMQQHSANAVKVIAISSHPELIRKRVEFAKLAGGHRDRDAIDTALGFLPTAKGATFVTNVNVAKPAGGEVDALDAEVVEGDVDHLFPSVSHMQARVTELRAGLLGKGE